MLTRAAFIFVIGVLITIHEAGHFAMARLLGAPVEVFSVGFGKRLWGFERGGTDYRISLIPLGGYVRIIGLGPDESDVVGDGAIETELLPRWKRALILLAGPLTNIGTAIDRAPDVIAKIEHLVIMGGAMREGGNYSPSAEFNILVDPHAADIVFNCGRPITAMGLDVTHQVLSTRDRVARIRELGNPVADATAGMLGFFERHDSKKYGVEGAPLHDPCTIAWLLQPELFDGKACNLSVETKSELTMGHTAIDFWRVTARPHNVMWVYAVDADGFYDLLTSRLARFGDLDA